MNIKDFFSMMREFKQYENEVIKGYQSQRENALQEALQLLPEDSGGSSTEDVLFQEMIRGFFSRRDAGPAPQAPLSPPSIPSGGSADESAFSMREARQLADSLRSHMPRMVTDRLVSGSISRDEAVTFLRSWNLPEKNAGMVYDAFMEGKHDEGERQSTLPGAEGPEPNHTESVGDEAPGEHEA